MMYYYRINGGLMAVTSPIVGENPLTAEEYAQARSQIAVPNVTEESAENAYWRSVPYDEAVNAKIRERYTESQEFAILRQRDEKPDEYAEYYTYCEQCKNLYTDVRRK